MGELIKGLTQSYWRIWEV